MGKEDVEPGLQSPDPEDTDLEQIENTLAAENENENQSENENQTQPEQQLDWPVDPEWEMTISFLMYGENGYTITSRQQVTVKAGQTLKDAGVEFPEMSSYEGLEQIGWMDESGQEVTEDTKPGGSFFGAYAKYSKGVVKTRYLYPDKSGYWASDIRTVTYEHGDTYGD